MVSYQIQIDDKMALGKSIIALLKSASEVVHLKKAAVKEEKHSPLYYELESAFRDVKLMETGKKQKKTAQEFLYELRNTNN